MTLLWVTEHFVMRRLSETMKINVSLRKPKGLCHRQNGYAKQNIILLNFFANKSRSEL